MNRVRIKRGHAGTQISFAPVKKTLPGTHIHTLDRYHITQVGVSTKDFLPEESGSLSRSRCCIPGPRPAPKFLCRGLNSMGLNASANQYKEVN